MIAITSPPARRACARAPGLSWAEASRAVCGELAAGSTSAGERQVHTILAKLVHLMYDGQQCGGNVEIQTRYAPRTEAATIPNAHDEMTDDRRILQRPRSALSDPAEPRPCGRMGHPLRRRARQCLAQKFAARHKAAGQRGIVKCGWPGTIVKEYLRQRRLDVERIVPWLRAHGGYCDCEVLYNVVDEFGEIVGE